MSGSAFCTVKSVPLTLVAKYCVEMRFRDLSKWSKFTAPGISKQDVDPAHMLLNSGKEVVEVVQVRNIAADTLDAAANHVHGRVQLALAAPRDKYTCALRDKTLGSGETDAAVASGNNSDLTFELTYAM
jgi:hypothetical protein